MVYRVKEILQLVKEPIDIILLDNCKQGVGDHDGLAPFTLISILRPKKENYENSNISPCKNIIITKK